MFVKIDDELFGPISDYIKDENVTDIKWNGSKLWIDDLNKGRFVAKDKNGNPLQLSNEWLTIFSSRIANLVNENFNLSEPSLKAETDELRIQVEHGSVSGDDQTVFTIRKTPCVSRLENKDLVKSGYCDEITEALLPCLMRARCSGVVCGEVGSGKTELIKYLAKFIPDLDGIVTVEDTLELRLKILYPQKDVSSIRITDTFTQEQAIRDALRLMIKWLIIAESRGRDIGRVMEGASTGCHALTSIHVENAWDMPDRMINMMGDEASPNFENDVYTFFNYAIKIKADITDEGIKRHIDQICFFDRINKENRTVVFMKDGKLTGEKIPNTILWRMLKNQKKPDFLKYEYNFFNLYKSHGLLD